MKYLKEQQPLNEKHFMDERRREKPHKLEGSVMVMKKGEKSQTCLINVFNFLLFAEPPGSVTRKGLLEGA